MIYHFLVVCSNTVTILHRFRDVATFTVYVTACDLEKFFISIRQLKLQATCAIRTVCEHIAINMCYVARGVWVRKIWNSSSDLQDHSRSLILVPFDTLRMI